MGEASIKVMHSADIFDVIRVKVVSSIQPQSPVYVHQGGEVNFMYDEGTANAQWRSNNEAIMTVDSAGHAKARNVGTTTIVYEGDATLSSHVHVARVGEIKLDESTKPEFFTNVPSNSYYLDEYRL